MRFAVHMAHRFKPALAHGQALAAAGDALDTYLALTRSTGLRLSPTERQGLMAAAVRYLVLREQANVKWKPKCHLLVHLCHSAGRFGNPRLMGNWIDEGLNMALAAVCKKANAAVWSKRVMLTCVHLCGPTVGSVKRRKGGGLS